MSEISGLLVATERLGHGHFFGTRTEMDQPTATCHLQQREDLNALCGYEWEGLVLIPGSPEWTDLHPDLRCDECSGAVGVTTEDPEGRTYRFTF